MSLVMVWTIMTAIVAAEDGDVVVAVCRILLLVCVICDGGFGGVERSDDVVCFTAAKITSLFLFNL